MTFNKKNFLDLPFEVKQVNNEDSQFFYFEGYASTFGNVDYGNDVVQKGAFIDSLAKNPSVPILWQHDRDIPIGVSIDLYEDEKGLYIKGKLPKGDRDVSGKVIPQMQVGSIKEMSIGFYLEDYEIIEDKRVLKKINLFEVSLVTKAMNNRALITDFKSVAAKTTLGLAPRDTSWDGSAAEKRIRDYTGSSDKPSAEYKKYFMYYDAENAENFTAYKLLFADVIDGEVVIVPKAVFAIAAALKGARGGVDIPATDENKIKTVVNSFYKRMAKEFEDESIVSPLIKSMDSLREIEQLLKSAGFSNSESKALISKAKEFSNQRDVEEEKLKQRDAESKEILKGIQDLTELLKKHNK